MNPRHHDGAFQLGLTHELWSKLLVSPLITPIVVSYITPLNLRSLDCSSHECKTGSFKLRATGLRHCPVEQPVLCDLNFGIRGLGGLTEFNVNASRLYVMCKHVGIQRAGAK